MTTNAQSHSEGANVVVGLLILGGIALGIALALHAWTDSWWSLLAFPAAIAAVVAITVMTPSGNKGKAGVAATVGACALLSVLFPAVSGSTAAPGTEGDANVNIASLSAASVWGGYTTADKQRLCNDVDSYGWDEAARSFIGGYGIRAPGSATGAEVWAEFRPLVEAYC